MLGSACRQRHGKHPEPGEMRDTHRQSILARSYGLSVNMIEMRTYAAATQLSRLDVRRFSRRNRPYRRRTAAGSARSGNREP